MTNPAHPPVEHEPRLRAEHQILFASKTSEPPNAGTAPLRTFFVRYAKQHLRDLPWRRPGVPTFHLLLAEILLKQTKAEDVATVWPRLIHTCPTPAILAKTRHTTLVSLLKPLGLQQQRASALQALGKAIEQHHQSNIPTALRGLLTLPHVGLYAATAVACFGLHTRVPIVDANVIRVLSRIAGLDGSKELRRRPDIWSLAWHILPHKNAALHNYGILDFAAQCCRARAPSCSTCPLQTHCAYAQQLLTTGSLGCAARSE
jgi:A/G-specific adenine glycosylase